MPSAAPASPPRTARGQLDLSDLSPADQASFQALRRWRFHTAQEQGVPPFVVLTNRHLLELIEKRPGSRSALGRIHGIGKAKVERYGAALLDILWGAPEEAGRREAGPPAPSTEPSAGEPDGGGAEPPVDPGGADTGAPAATDDVGEAGREARGAEGAAEAAPGCAPETESDRADREDSGQHSAPESAAPASARPARAVHA